MSDARIDPELLRQLESTGDDEPVQAIVHLKTANPAQAAPAPEETVATTHAIVDRVKKLAGEGEKELNIFRHLGSFMICAQPRFLKILICQPEVAAAAANKQPGTGLIDPVRKRPADLREVGADGGGSVKRARGTRPRRRQS